MDHSKAVTKHYLPALNSLEDGYWDDVFRETSYYMNSEVPDDNHPRNKGREVGEFDVLLVNYDDKVMMYKELKTKHHQLDYAEDQLERAENHFDDWDFIGNKILE